jgi:RNA polymerase sigma factor (sigma-70 family)
MIMWEVTNTKGIIDEFVSAYDELKVLAMTLEHNENDALDLMQDLAEILLVKGEELQNVRVPIAYFKTCLRHLKYNKVVKNAKETIVSPDDIDVLNREPQEDLDISCMEILEWLKKQLASSPPEFREAFIKYHIDGHPLEQVAEDLNMTPNTLSQKFSRMRRKL